MDSGAFIPDTRPGAKPGDTIWIPPGAAEADHGARPEPLPSGIASVDPFDAELLPVSLREWVLGIAERIQCPVDFPAVTAMIGAAGMIGRSAVMLPGKDGQWRVTPNLWGCIIGRPGVMKTPAVTAALAPVQAMEIKLRDAHKVAEKLYEADSLLFEARQKAAKDALQKAVKSGAANAEQLARAAAAGEESAPKRKRILTSDPTTEKLGELLNENPRGLILYRDELVGWLRDMDRRGREGDRAFYLQAWNGDGRYTIDRIGRGTIEVESLCISVIGTIQPGPLGAYLSDAHSGGIRDDGFIQRFQLAVWPDHPTAWEYVESAPRAGEAERIEKLYTRIASAALPNRPREFRFDAEAQHEFARWRRELERRLRGGDLSLTMEGHLAKFRSLIPTIALICCAIDSPNSSNVGIEDLLRAIAWGEYLERHAVRIYGWSRTSKFDLARQLLVRLRRWKLSEGFTRRDVVRAKWSGFTDEEPVDAALAVLTEYRYLGAEEIAPSPGGGRPTVRYRLASGQEYV